MLQREVADRFFASPWTKAYGADSVLVRLHSRRTGIHTETRTVFPPPPNVDSALVAFARVAGPSRPNDVRRVVTAAFAHRRKTLANSVSLAGLASREQVADVLRGLGRDANVRAEALEPDEFVELAARLMP
jgi:16S rRNA (adenine1518-N6/adenine1519-N6)-dimethyltransferase